MNTITKNEMPKERFDLDHAKYLYELDSNKYTTDGKKQERIGDRCKNYVMKYLFVTDKGVYKFWDAKCQKLTEIEEIEKTYLKRLPKPIQDWFKTEMTCLFTIINDLNAPLLDYNKKEMNAFQGFLYSQSSVKKYAEYNDAIKENINVFFKYIFEVLANCKQDHYEYYLNWIANICQGNKNDSCIYQKGPEGIGKSTLTDFLIKYVFGNNVSIKAPASVLTSKFNSPLCGSVFVVFEELPTITDRDWENASSVLKASITSIGEVMYEPKGGNPFPANDLCNYIINANVEALKDSSGRRYFIAEISTEKMQDAVYFSNVTNKCFNKETGEAFFAYCLERDLTNYRPQTMPETRNKLDAIADRLDSVYKFLKFEYILRRQGINRVKVDDLYENYKDYCGSDKFKYTKTKFCQKLREIQVEYTKSNGDNYYFVTYDQLQKVADKRKWIHELDVYANENENEMTPTDANAETIAYLTSQVDALSKQIKLLQFENMILKENANKSNNNNNIFCLQFTKSFEQISAELNLHHDKYLQLSKHFEVNNTITKDDVKKVKEVKDDDDDDVLELMLDI